MKTYVLYYDNFAEFETIMTCLIMAHVGDIIGVALEDRPYVSEEKQTFLPNMLVSEVDPDDVDLFFIPGGNPESIADNPDLKELLFALNEKGTVIAAICGGPIILGHIGLLKGLKFTANGQGITKDSENYAKHFEGCEPVAAGIVEAGNLVTATGQSYMELAIALGKKLGVYKDEVEPAEDLKWLKNQT